MLLILIKLSINQIYELQPYRAQIKNLLDVHQPFFVYEERGNKLDCFNPQLIKHAQCKIKDVILHNSRFQNKEKNDKYHTITRPNRSLWHLHYFFENEYHSYDVDVFNKVINSYNITFIYNNFENNMMHIGFSEWS